MNPDSPADLALDPVAEPPARILLVDDEPGLRTAVKAYLEDEGFQVTTAGDGEEGWVQAQELLPDVVITDVNPYRLELAQSVGVTRAVNTTETSLAAVQKELGMTEGFDVGLEMSGNPHAFRDMLANMAHGAHIAMLGIPAGGDMAIDWNTVIFNMLTIKGIYGREMYETWYQMSVMLESGLNLKPVITHRFPYTEFEQGFTAMESGSCGKVVLDWNL